MATVTRLDVDIGAKTDKLNAGIKAAEGQLNGFSKQIIRIGGLLAAAFSVRELVRFGGEASRLAGQMEGVEAAFNRLNQPDLLDRLTKATRGTVSELELMQKAVMADNFRIPLDTFAQGLEFATRRAKETGQEVDFLVNSFVTGIGRKSQLVMDNLGISVLELQEEIKLTGDFATAVANIMSREMSKAGEDIETSAEKTAQLTAAFSDLQVVIGDRLNPTLDKAKEKMTAFLQSISSTAQEKGIKVATENIADFTKEIAKLGKEVQLKKIIDELEVLQLALAIQFTIPFDEQTDSMKAYEAELGHRIDELKRIQSEIIAGTFLQKEETTEIKKAVLSTEQLLKLREDFLIAMRKTVALEKQEAKHFSDLLNISMDNMERDRPAFAPDLDFQNMLEMEMLDKVDADLSEFVNGLQDKANQIQMVNAVIAQSFTDMFVAIGSGLGESFTGGMENFFNNILKTMADFAIKFGTLLIAMGISREALKTIGATGIGAIIAGTALVAAGTALKGTLKDIQGANLSAGGGGGSSRGYASAAGSFSPQTIKIEGVLKGNDIYWSNKGYANVQNALT